LEKGNPLSQQSIKKHFIVRRKAEFDFITGLDQHAKLKYIVERIDKAIELHAQLRKENIKITGDTTYLKIWKNLLENFKS
jgi:hypothetical protein